MIHQIKISNQFFDDVQSGKKNFEKIRNYTIEKKAGGEAWGRPF